MATQNLLSPIPSLSQPVHSSNPVSSNFPVLAVAVVGICATAFLLVSYYVFVIKCCLNWHRLEFLHRFSLSRSRRRHEPLILHSPPLHTSPGLNSSVIRSIPLVQYDKPTDDDGRFLNCECAVCLAEFQQHELLRKLPNCTHLFHIDCIDIWLQNNSNCPICRTTISISFSAPNCLMNPIDNRLITPTPSPRDPIPFSGNLVSTADEDFVVIEFRNNYERPPERSGSGEIPSSSTEATNSAAKLGRRRLQIPKYGRKLEKMTSMGDEFIDTREKDEQFSIQPIRRSFSMDSSADRQLYLGIQEMLQQKSGINASLSPIDGCSSSRVRKSFFTFGHGRGSRNTAVLPIYSEP